MIFSNELLVENNIFAELGCDEPLTLRLNSILLGTLKKKIELMLLGDISVPEIMGLLDIDDNDFEDICFGRIENFGTEFLLYVIEQIGLTVEIRIKDPV